MRTMFYYSIVSLIFVGMFAGPFWATGAVLGMTSVMLFRMKYA